MIVSIDKERLCNYVGQPEEEAVAWHATETGEEDTASFVKGLDASRTVCDQAALLCQPSKSTNKLLSVTGPGNVARQLIF